MKYPDYEEIQRYSEGREADATTEAELVRDLKAMGVEGRHVMVHSSFRTIRPVKGGPQAVVNAFVAAVGWNGVVLFPAFDFHSWSDSGYWDRQNSTSKMGAISEVARKDAGFERTSHPMLSFAVRDLGRGGGTARSVADLSFSYEEDIQSAHGENSAFSKFVEKGGLLLSFSGAGFRENDVGYTISNHAAVIAEVPWRHTKVFEGTYVDGGSVEIRKYSASICSESYVTQVSPAHEAAEREGVIRRLPFGRAECVVADAREFVDWAVASHKERPELWRRVK